jgi:hypothetical protein
MKQAIIFPEILEEQNTKTDLFKPALSPDVDTIFKLNRKLKDFNFILERLRAAGGGGVPHPSIVVAAWSG